MNTDQRQLAKDALRFFRTHYMKADEVKPGDLAFVFGRKDAAFAASATVLYKTGTKKVLVTGGIGRDSKELIKLKIPEAHFLASLMLELGVHGDDLLVEPMATNGAANSKLGTEMIVAASIPAKRIILIGHPMTLLRLSAVHTRITRAMGFEAEYQLFAVDTDFNLDREADQWIILDECWRLYDYPLDIHLNRETGVHEAWADQITIPEDLLEQVLSWKELHSK